MLAVGSGKVARQKLTYRMLGSPFHDGSRMSVADLLYSTMFSYRWGAGGEQSHSDPVVAAVAEDAAAASVAAGASDASVSVV